LETEPNILSQLVLMATVSMAQAELEHALSCGQPSDAQLTKLSHCFDEAKPDRMAVALAGERAEHIPFFRMNPQQMTRFGQQYAKDDGSAHLLDTNTSSVNPLGWTGFFERDLSFYLDCMETNIAIAGSPTSKILASTNVPNRNESIARSRLYIFSSLLLPSMSRIFVKELNDLARCRLTQTAIAVERFRVTHGRLPDSLNNVAPEFLPSVPQDPFDGNPLRYKRLSKGYVVYSVGADGVDDAGKEYVSPYKRNKSRSSNAGPTTCDVTFIVER
jgi:hypothetical protein